MRRPWLRPLALVLISQQLAYSVPAGAMLDAPTGLPVDAPTLALHAQNASLAVTPSPTSGDATHEIPILAPPGTGGHTPDVALTYSSGDTRRSGPLGVGWQLDVGPAAIERSTRNGASAFDTTDTFELGGQRLIVTNQAGRYVTEDYDFSRIERVGDYWIVMRPDGTRLYYGYEPGPDPSTGSILYSAEVKAIDPTPAACPTPFVECLERETIIPAGIPFAWYLDRVEDSNGNVIRYVWESLGDLGMRYLTAILYSEHVAGSLTQVPGFGSHDDGSLTMERAIYFDYDASRDDVMPTYRTGFPRQIRHRLQQIDVEVNSALVRRYVLSYEQSPASGRSRLRFVRERDATGATGNELVTELRYGDGGTPVGGSFWSAKDTRWALPGGLQFVSSSGADLGVRLVDVDTDGFPDVVHAHTGTHDTYRGGPGGFLTSAISGLAVPENIISQSGYAGAVFGDFDGDGRQDFLRRQIEVTATNQHSEACGTGNTNRHHEVVNGPQGSFNLNEAWINDGWGWIADATHTHGFNQYATDKLAEYGDTNSCPYEYLPFADEISGTSTSFDQATRVIDVNGDGRDDFVFFRELHGDHRFNDNSHTVDESRAGTLLNGPGGLSAGTLNWSYASVTERENGYRVQHRRYYDSSRWQIPHHGTDPGSAWSITDTCKPGEGDLLAGSHSGRERLVDINTDGLPDILEHIQRLVVVGGQLLPESPTSDFFREHINNGYGWKAPSIAPETSLEAPVFHYAIAGGESELGNDCEQGGDDFAFDYGTQLVDVNGDGGPDAIGSGDDGHGISLWSARLTPEQTLWHPVSAWDMPVTLRASSPPAQPYDWPASAWNGPPGGARLADVDNDGMVDIVVSNGAYLNLGEPPDMLEEIRTPYGAVTTLEYEPHTVFGTAPSTNFTEDGQYEHPQARWVVTRIEVDPGSAFGEPAISREFEYYDPVYDITDRAFRGFKEVRELGPVVDDVRAATKTLFHVSDELRGRPKSVVVSSVKVNNQPANPNAWTWTDLEETRFDYAYGSGAGGYTVVRWNGSHTSFSSLGDTITPAAFSAFRNLFSGSPVASQAFLSFPVQQTSRTLEGQASGILESAIRRRFDFYGNLREIVELGNPSIATDDVTSVFQYAVQDRAIPGDWLYLTNRPISIVRTGQLADLPPGTNLSRQTEILYDGASGNPASQTLVRGNPTAVLRAWTDAQGSATQVRVDQIYDIYGNVLETSSAYDVAGPGRESFHRVIYDGESATFPIHSRAGSYADPNFDLNTDLYYESPYCGAPPGLGLVCDAVEPNGAVTTHGYDAFGRLISSSGPNGAALAMLYHDGDRATANQRTETRLRWSLAGPADPGTDANAIALVTYTDGLGRALEERKTGRGSDIARRMRDYDAAGRLAALSRWDFGTTPIGLTVFAYDAIGRPVRVTHPDTSFDTVEYLPGKRTTKKTIPGDGWIHRRAESSDEFGRVFAVDEYESPTASPATTTYAYDAFGMLVRVRDAKASQCGSNAACLRRHTTQIFYDKLGNRVRLEDPDSGTWLSAFDARGLPVRSEDPRGKVQTLAYDDLGRLERRHAENPMEASEADDVFTYGLADTTVPNGIGRLVLVEDSEGSDSFRYDAAGNISFHSRTLLGRRFDFTHSYDPLGRRVATLHPDGEMTVWSHDKSLLARVYSQFGAYAGDYLANASYDALDRPLSIALGGNAGAPAMTKNHDYDPVTGRLARLEAVVGGEVIGEGDYTIDGAGRVRAIDMTLRRLTGTLTDSILASFSYDGLDRITAGGGFTNDHDVLGNLVDKDVLPSPPAGAWSVMDYTDPLRPHALTHAAWTNGSRTADYLYDAAGNVRVKTRTGPGSPISNANLLYDSQGRTHRIRVSGGRTTVLRYGALGQRLGTTQWETNGDADGDGQVLNSDFDLLTEQFGVSGPGASADFDGDLAVDSDDILIVWSQWGQPVTGPSVLEPEPGFEYHTQQNLVNKHFFVGGVRVASSARNWTAPLASTSPVTPRWSLPELPLPPGWAVMGSLYGSLGVLLLGAALSRRRPGLALPGLRLRAGAAGTLLVVSPALLASPCNTVGPPPVSGLGTHGESVLFYATDHLGSTLLTVGADGTRSNRFIYMPYGDPGSWQEGAPLRHRFTGGEVVAETGFYVLGARVYDPELGRFLQPDPLVGDPSDPQSFNRYTYARNNPLGWVDPSGLDPLPPPRNTLSPRPVPRGGVSYGPGPSGRDYYSPSDFSGRGPGSLGHQRRESEGGSAISEAEKIARRAGLGGTHRPTQPQSVATPASKKKPVTKGSSREEITGSVGASGGTMVWMIGPVPIGVFGAAQMGTEGRISSEGGVGIAVGSISGLTGEGGVKVQAGDPGPAELAFIAEMILPFARVGPIFDARVSLATLGASVQVGLIRGHGVFGFIGPVFQGPGTDVRTVTSFGHQSLQRLISEGSGIPGHPGPPPPSAISPF